MFSSSSFLLAMLPVLLVVCLFWRMLLCAELPGDHISLELSIRAGDSWVSKDGTFAIGLLPDFSPGDASQEQMNLSIWYRSLPSRTVVWTAASNGKVLNVVGSNATFSVTGSGLLLGSVSIWSTRGSESCEGCFAQMRDDGNFVLVSAGGETVWQSFDSPTDTLLPREGNLSGVGEDKVLLTSGKFQLSLTSKSLKLSTPDFSPPPPNHVDYWSLYNPGDNPSGKPPTFSFRRDGVLTFTDGAGKSSNYTSITEIGTIRYSSDYGNIVPRRLVLEPDGNLRIYSLRNTSWIIVWQAVLKECEIYATCGAFGVCSYRPKKTCSCPPGFHRDPSEGCVRSTALDCNSNKTKFVELARADYVYNDLAGPIPAITMDECKSKCLKSCTCLAVAYKLEGSGRCFLKGQDNKLYNGVQSMDQNTVVFLKVSPASDPTTLNLASASSYITDVNASYVQPIVKNLTKKEPYFHRSIHLVFAALSSGELVLFLVLCTILCLFWLRDHRRMMQKYKVDIQGGTARFSFRELQAATNNFSEKLGSGAFGSVYKGVLPDNRIIAVKQLEVHVQAERQFKAEVSTIGSIHHINLVRLLGYCAEGNHRLLVLEYMPNGSLERLLVSSNEGNEEFCSWSTRYSIALGIARGITYLHEECHECILHCDIKPQNILLDENFQPKVSDFGLAKLMSSKDQRLDVTTIAGTRGYLAPEWVSNLQITSKVDVYSFGMVLLEILSGRDNLQARPSALDSNKWPFAHWAFRRYLESRLRSIADPKLEMSEPEWEQFERMLKVAFWCIQLDANSRPSMGTVVQMLEKHLEVPQPPCPGSFDQELPRLPP